MPKESRFDSWLSRAGNTIALWSIVPVGILSFIGGYLASGVGWINTHLGAWGWFMAGTLTFFVLSGSLALIGKFLLSKAVADHRRRLESGSSAFDPMEPVYRNKRLFLRDLAPAGRLMITGKNFINCEIIGPGNIVIGLPAGPDRMPVVRESRLYEDVDCIQVAPDIVPHNAIRFVDCDFDRCHFYNLSLLFIRRENEALHWITPAFEQPPLLMGEGPAQALGIENEPEPT